MTTKFHVTIWDSMTGETSFHGIETETSIDMWSCPEQVADTIHAAVCKEIGEDPADWARSPKAPILSSAEFAGRYTGPDAVCTMYANSGCPRGGFNCSIEIVMGLN